MRGDPRKPCYSVSLPTSGRGEYGLGLLRSLTLGFRADRGMHRKPEDLFVRRQTARMRLSKFAAHNTYHHCEQCHQYMGFHPRCQVGRSPRQPLRWTPAGTSTALGYVLHLGQHLGFLLLAMFASRSQEVESSGRSPFVLNPPFPSSISEIIIDATKQ